MTIAGGYLKKWIIDFWDNLKIETDNQLNLWSLKMKIPQMQIKFD